MTRIYTRGGDQGETGLQGGTRVSKSDLRVCAYGTVDELNSVIGLAASFLEGELRDEWLPELRLLQERLFVLGAQISDPEDEWDMQLPEGEVDRLEEEIDELQEQLPELKNFILPGGDHPAAFLHQARTVCRRAERRCVALVESGGELDDQVLAYLNRLGDFLFVLARYFNHAGGTDEPVWRGRGEQ